MTFTGLQCAEDWSSFIVSFERLMHDMNMHTVLLCIMVIALIGFMRLMQLLYICMRAMWPKVPRHIPSNRLMVNLWPWYSTCLTGKWQYPVRDHAVSSGVGPWKQGSWGQHGAHLGPTGPRWAPCWPHELCYLGLLKLCSLMSLLRTFIPV